MSQGQPGSSSSLVRGKLSRGAVLFQSVSLIAPAAGIATAAIIAANFTGGAMSLAAVVAVLGALCVAVSVSQLAQHLPSAGSVGTFVAKGLGGPLGFWNAWMYTIAEILVVTFVSLMSGNIVAGVMNSEFNWSFKATWIVVSVGVLVAVTIVHELGITVSANVQRVVSIVEILFFLILAIALIIAAGRHNTLAVFTVKYGNVPGFKGWAGILPGIIFMVTGFAGFESAASLAEEAREPRKAVSFAVIGSILAIGALYVLTSYAATVYFGAGKMGGFAAFNNGDPWTGLTKQVWGVGWVVLFVILVNSLFACANAGTNVSTRMLFSLGRSGLLPARVGRVHARRQTPFAALMIVMVIALALSLWLGLKYGPLMGFAILAVTSTSFIVSMYVLVQLACIAYFWRFQRQHFNWFLHLVVPVAGIALFIPVLLADLGIPVLSFIGKLSPPLSYGAYASFGIAALGLVVAIILAVVRPDRLAQFGHGVFGLADEDESVEKIADGGNVIVEPAGS
jgi:amino acid transporter